MKHRKRQPINPITVRGHRPADEKSQWCLTIGRLWLGSNVLAEGQHRFDPKSRRENWEKTMQFIVWEPDPQYFMLGDEDVIQPESN